jgi:serine phosphatase RsbU (regulator of sigma subunit)/tetratricopeptide (TPR) repeat protein
VIQPEFFKPKYFYIFAQYILMPLIPDKNSNLKLFLLMVILLTLGFSLKAQNNKKVDSLYAVIKSSKIDTVKINARLKIASILFKNDSLSGYREIKKATYAINNISYKSYVLRTIEKIGKFCYSGNMPQKARYYYDMGLSKSRTQKNKEWQARFYLRIANLLQNEDFSKQCIVYYDSALTIAKGGDEKQLADILMKTGRAHYDNGDYKVAMDLYIQSQRLFEKNKWLNTDYGHLLHFIGSVFKRQGFKDKALNYYERELALAVQIKNKSLEAESLYLCASMYGTKGDLDKELAYNEKSMEIYKEEGNFKMVGLLLGNISANYADKKEYKKAIANCEEALGIYDQLGQKDMQSSLFRSLGDYYSKLGQHAKALNYMKQAMDAALKVETKQLLYRAEITESMAFAYSNLGDYKSAFNALLQHRKLNDSLNNQSNAEYMHNLETQYQTEKKEKEIALLNAGKKVQDEALLRKEAQSKTLIIVCILVFVIAGISIFAFMAKQKTSRILTKQVSEINYQNSVIVEKNKDITDSIQYAKRLQEAVFPEVDTLNGYFAESFVLFRPKDIVSGDFYWFEQAGDKTILAVGDCTGHGVPGAFMSILGHNLLNQIILEYGITNPSEILRMLDKQVSNALNKKGTRQEYNDGMDIAICVLDKKKKNLLFAGANRPLVIKRGGELIELKPNKFAIGGIQDDSCKLFLQQEVPALENDILYLFSDGYYDQFGGPKGKKFKYKRLVEYITAISAKPLEEQKNILSEVLESWKGNLEQVDDVCVIGVKI